MRIAITGTGGIGKTMLATALSEELQIPLIEEGIQPVVNALLELGKAGKARGDVKAAQEQYARTCWQWLQDRNAAYGRHGNFVADRFAIDVLARWVMSGVGRNDDHFLIRMVKECQHQSSTLDLIVMPPLVKLAQKNVPNEQGMHRHESVAMKLFSQSMSRGLIEQLLTTPRLYLPLRCSTVEQRVEAVKSALSKLKRKP